jgi:predicted nucleic acid-binding protein
MTVYPDSMLWVYFFERNPQFHPATRAFMARCQAARCQFLSSYLVLAEVLVVPKRNHDVFTAMRYRRILQPSAVTMLPLTADAAERFADPPRLHARQARRRAALGLGRLSRNRLLRHHGHQTPFPHHPWHHPHLSSRGYSIAHRTNPTHRTKRDEWGIQHPALRSPGLLRGLRRC